MYARSVNHLANGTASYAEIHFAISINWKEMHGVSPYFHPPRPYILIRTWGVKGQPAIKEYQEVAQVHPPKSGSYTKRDSEKKKKHQKQTQIPTSKSQQTYFVTMTSWDFFWPLKKKWRFLAATLPGWSCPHLFKDWSVSPLKNVWKIVKL